MFKTSRRRRSKKYLRKRKTRTQRGGSQHIPMICFQTSKEPIAEYIVARLKQYIKGWTYEFYTDKEILEFFDKHRHPDYPADKLLEKFHSFTHGEHKADLFRYYYLLIKGGVFIDSDLLIYDNLSTIIGAKEFVSVRAIKPVNSVFNGFLAATPNHPIIQDAMKDIMKVTNIELAGTYHLLVARLGDFVDKHMNSSVKLLKEISNDNKSCNIEDPETGEISMIHYQNMAPPKFPIQHPSP